MGWIESRISRYSDGARRLYEVVKSDELFHSYVETWESIPIDPELEIVEEIASMTAVPDEMVFSVDDEPDIEFKFSLTITHLNEKCKRYGINANSILYLFYIKKAEILEAEMRADPSIRRQVEIAKEDYRSEKGELILRQLSKLLNNREDPLLYIHKCLDAVKGTDPFIISQIISIYWKNPWFFRSKSPEEICSLLQISEIHKK